MGLRADAINKRSPDEPLKLTDRAKVGLYGWDCGGRGCGGECVREGA